MRKKRKVKAPLVSAPDYGVLAGRTGISKKEIEQLEIVKRDPKYLHAYARRHGVLTTKGRVL